MSNPCWFVLLLLAAWLGHFAMMVASHNWFYAKPFPRLVGDLVQLFHVILGFLGLGWVFQGVWILSFHQGNSWPDSLAETYSLLAILTALIGVPWFESKRWRLKHSVSINKLETEKKHWPSSWAGEKMAWRLPGNQSLFLEIRTIELPVENLPLWLHGLEILHFSDTHFGGNDKRSYFENLFNEASKRTPDFIFFTGDLVDAPEYLSWVVPLLGRLRARRGKFAIRGNHDFWNLPEEVAKSLRRAGFCCLGNGQVELDFGNGNMGSLLGNERPWNNQVNQVEAAGNSQFTILLAHTPDQAVLAANQGVNLAFCGHVHGGQVRIPFIGPLLLPSIHGRLFDHGFYKIAKLIMHVSRGIAGGFPYRFNCLPEIAWVRLVEGKKGTNP